MGLKEPPEVKLARKILKKHSLSIPFNIDTLVEKYATLHYKYIPISGIDGVSINLKVPGKTPTVIVSSSLPRTRQIFTLAHELGHIIIPWHLGTIVDEVYTQSYKDFMYSLLEQEANRFAAELLMPKSWILDLYSQEENLDKLHKKVVDISGVSDIAAAIRFIETLPPNILFVSEETGIVLNSGKTQNTFASLQSQDDDFDKNFYPHVKSYSVYNGTNSRYHWWDLNSNININESFTGSWREILDSIVEDIDPKVGAKKFKASLNGILAAAHGTSKHIDKYDINSVMVACLYRLKNRTEFGDFVNHEKFEEFLTLRVQDFFK